MQCPTCQNTDSRVLESRSADSGKSVRRRRECLNCSFRFTTYERVETMPVAVIKKDGRRELFDKQKLFTGISRACEKTTFTSEAIINFVDGIESQIIQDSNKDIKSSQIGELILKSLRSENEVAYIRYASVYRKFNGVKDHIFHYMQCPTCQNTDSRVLESRSADNGKSVRRRRECLNCSFRFTTYELSLIHI